MSETTADGPTRAREEASRSRFLNWIERVGNRVPNSAIMFLYLIAFILVLSAVLASLKISVTDQVVTPVPKQQLRDLRDALGGSIVPYDVRTQQPAEIPEYTVTTQTFPVKSLPSIAGIHFIFSSFVANFAGFGVIAVTLIAMAGVGVAEKAGMMGALIRKLVAVAPAALLSLLSFVIILVGVLSSVAPDAGYLILIPLGAAAFLSVGRHPLAGLAGYGALGMLAVVLLLSLPPGAPLREPTTGALIRTTPFMDSLIFIIVLTFLVCGICYGLGARTIHAAEDVVTAIGQTVAGLGGMLLMFLMIAQFIAFFNYTNMPRVAAVEAAQALERVRVPPLLLLLAMILVIVVLNFILPGVVPKWAVFAPVFVPIFARLDVTPQTVLAAYRRGGGRAAVDPQGADRVRQPASGGARLQLHPGRERRAAVGPMIGPSMPVGVSGAARRTTPDTGAASTGNAGPRSRTGVLR